VPPGDLFPGGFEKFQGGARYRWNFFIHIDNFPDILKPKLSVSNLKRGLTIYYF